MGKKNGYGLVGRYFVGLGRSMKTFFSYIEKRVCLSLTEARGVEGLSLSQNQIGMMRVCMFLSFFEEIRGC